MAEQVWSLNHLHLLIAGAIATKGSFSVEIQQVTDTDHGYDNIEVIKACCEYLSHSGYLRWFLKEIDGKYYLTCQEGDIWNVRKE
ncbi:MAG: hypothetical protein OXI43_13875 [Candidatus Poribacteria bacterium]|nr:hypothetical protein [Candidatus Poribacteria bacterium]